MAIKKRKAAKKKSGKKSKPQAPAKLHTKFMDEFVSEFIGKKKPFKWPDTELLAPAVLAQFEMIVNVLMKAGYLLSTPAPDGTDPLRDRVIEFLNTKDWPRTAPIPKKWQKMKPTVRLIEVAVIADHLLEAINDHVDGGAGGGSHWPPHPPR